MSVEPPLLAARPLQRSLLASTLVVVSFLLVATLVIAPTSIYAEGQPGLSGLGVGLLGLVLAPLLAFPVAAVLAHRSWSFTGSRRPATAAVLALLLALVSLAFPPLLAITVPLVWTLPAALAGLMTRRTLAVAAGVGLVVASVASALVIHRATRVQDDALAAYAGPVRVPAAQSPVLGYELLAVSLPNEFDTTDLEVQWRRYGADNPVGEENYVLTMSEGDSDAPYCQELVAAPTRTVADPSVPECVEVGEASGLVVHKDQSGTYGQRWPNGWITLEGDITDAEALIVYESLEPGSIEDLVALGEQARY